MRVNPQQKNDTHHHDQENGPASSSYWGQWSKAGQGFHVLEIHPYFKWPFKQASIFIGLTYHFHDLLVVHHKVKDE